MANSARLAAVAALLCLAAPAYCQDRHPAPRTISVDELSPGMRGYGLTVISGMTPERFDVEIIDVLRGVAPGRNAVLVRASGLGLEQSGIIAGMSGSPVYVDDRLVGAVAFGWAWPKEPISGVTPIDEMDRALTGPMDLAESSPSWERFDLASILAGRRPFSALAPALEPGSPQARTALETIAVPLVVPALSRQARAIAEALFPPDRFLFTEGVAGAFPQASDGPARFEPGSSVFAALVTGDMVMGAIGTVTDVRGDEVFGFGHPFTNHDDIAIPMYTANVSVIFPSSYKSFKIGSPVKEAGAITRDRATGILGVVGAKGRTVPMKVTLRRGGVETSFNYRIYDHYTMTGQLAATVAAASLTTLGDLAEDATLSYGFAADYAGGRRLKFKWRAAGPNATNAMGQDIAQALSTTMFNPLEMLDPVAINVDLEVNARDASAIIKSVTVRENEVNPGGSVHVVATVKPALSKDETVTIELAVPPNMLPGQKSLIVCDGRTSDVLDIQQAKHLLAPADVDELLRALTPRRSAGEIVARLADADRGVAISSDEFPRLPSSTLAILASPGQGDLSPVYYSVTASAETPYVVSGRSVIPINVVSREEQK